MQEADVDPGPATAGRPARGVARIAGESAGESAGSGADRSPDADAAAHLASELVDVGRRAGLDAVGVASAAPFADARRHLEDRRARGLAAEMQFTYRNPARSTDPRQILPSARALVVGARRTPAPRLGAATSGNARVAAYARVDHYADLRAALGEVADRLRSDGWQARVVADDNALVDRAAAVRAGLGWYGKNANVLLPGRGSWFVLGSVVTDAPLPPNQAPVRDGCGTCERCLTGCPTGAIVEPGVVDARRCLAWLAQAPGPIPVEFRSALGDRLYGCDDCQEVCPIGVAEREAEEARSGGRADGEPDAGADVAAVWILEADDQELLDRFGRWYIAERDPRYLRRNALVVLGNARGDDPGRSALLQRYARHADPLLREHAVWALEQCGRGQDPGVSHGGGGTG